MFGALLGLREAEASVSSYPRQTSDVEDNGGTGRLEPTVAPMGNAGLFKKWVNDAPTVCGYISDDIC
jgi:hypothetical protein